MTVERNEVACRLGLSGPTEPDELWLPEGYSWTNTDRRRRLPTLSRRGLRVALKQLKKGGNVMITGFLPMFIVMNIFCKMLKEIGRRFLLRAGNFWDSRGIIP